MRRSRAALVVVAALATASPIAAYTWVWFRLQRTIVPLLTDVLGRPVRIAAADADLLGTLRLRRVEVTGVFAADRVEASTNEIRVGRPRLWARVTGDGRLDLSELLTRARDRRRARGGKGGAGLRRIVVTQGELVVRLPEGELTARGVELHPQAGGVRVVTGPVSARLAGGGFAVTADFARAGLDLDLPGAHVRRAAADGGAVTLAAPGQPPLALAGVVLVRGARDTRMTAREGAVSLTLQPGIVELAADSLPIASLAPLLPGWVRPTGEAGGTMTLRRVGGEIRATASLRLRAVEVVHPVLAAVPLPWSGALELDGSFDPAARAGAGRVGWRSGPVRVNADVSVAFDEAGLPKRAAVAAEMPAVPCAQALAALPEPLRARLAGLDLSGTFGGRIAAGFDRDRPEATRLDVALDVGCAVLRDPESADVSALAGAYRHLLPDGATRVLGESDSSFVPLKTLPHHVLGAFVAAEDARFFEHRGFDPSELARSFAADVAAGRIERGGSTISQQLVKNLYLTPERTVARKLMEAVLTWRLEQRVAKARILELYLNIIELGGGAYGIDAGARRWFGKPARRLSAAEAAFLAAITPAPRTFDRRLAAGGRLDAETRARVEVVVGAMRRARVISGREAETAREEAARLRVRGV